jgi:hypothetical protein
LYPGDAPQRLANDEQQLLAANKAIHDPFTRRSLLEMARAAAGLLEERNH